MSQKFNDPLASGPFIRWLNDQIAESSMPAVVELIGWNRNCSGDAALRRLYRYRHGRSETNRGGSKGKKGKSCVVPALFFSRAVIEDALHHAGVDLEDVYPRERFPELFVDIPLEPETDCETCEDVCTPIFGVCPWCDNEVAA